MKNQICTEGSGADDQEQDDNQKKTSCFSNIKIFLVSECALMLAQGTVGAYLVSVRGHRVGAARCGAVRAARSGDAAAAALLRLGSNASSGNRRPNDELLRIIR